MIYNNDPLAQAATGTEVADEWAALAEGAEDFQGYEAAPLRPIILEAADNDETRPDSITARNQHIADFCADIIPEGYQVVMPHTAIATEDLGSRMAQKGLTESDTPVWVYGSVLPAELFARSTKVQVHEPFDGAEAPDWFDYKFPEYLKDTTVPGYSCFSENTLKAAVDHMLEEFPAVRLKNPTGSSGEEQLVVSSAEEMEAALATVAREMRDLHDMDLGEHLTKYGYVVEANVDNVTAWSATVTTLPNGDRFSSFGRLLESDVELPDGTTMREYGGTSSVVVRGDPTELNNLPEGGIVVYDPVVQEEIRLAPPANILHAAQRHIEGMRLWEEEGILRTRANVDVITGELHRNDGSVEHITASVEDSGRPGGASPAELLGIKELQDNPYIQFAVKSSRHSFNEAEAQAYADHTAQTPNGQTFWHGHDETWDGKHVFLGVF